MESPERELTLADYVAPIRARRWLILVAVLLATGGTYAYYSHQHKVFQASTKLYLAQESNPIVGAGAGFSDDRTVQNQATLLTSADVAAAVAKDIGFDGSPGALSGMVTAKPSQGTDFVAITGKGSSGQQAADIANGFARAFVRLRSEKQRAEILKALAQLKKQLAQIPKGAANDADRADTQSNMRQLRVALSSAPGNATQIDPAGIPGSPIAPKPTRNAIFAFVLALLGSVFLAYFLERFDPRLKKAGDARMIYRRPVLANIAHDDHIDHFNDGVPAVSPVSTEAFRELRVNLQLAALERPLKTILVTSANAAEGKSTVVRNFALALHEAGRRVAVIDADLRKPSLARLFGAQTSGGFTQVLAGERSVDEVITRLRVESSGVEALERMTRPGAPGGNGAPLAQTDSLTLIDAGPQPPNPPAVLESIAMREFLREVADRYDVVLLDTPPLLEVSDAIPLMGQVDAVLLAVRVGTTDRRGAQRAMETIERVPNVNFVGVVANDLTGADAGMYGGRYGYGYGYGSSEAASQGADAPTPAAGT
jgi:Mrp family chromosome partitioning ATPase/capsular polysaccharide biosynthesis protein